MDSRSAGRAADRTRHTPSPGSYLQAREGWTELRTGRAIGTYRRNLQRGYLERLDELMNGDGPSAPTSSFPGLDEYYTNVNLPQSDIRAVVRGELEVLQREIRNRLGAGANRMTRLHLQDALARIESILDPEE